MEIQKSLWTPAEGSQYAELDTDWDGPSGSFGGEPASVQIFEDLATIPGQTYQISFKFSPRPAPDPFNANDANNNKLEFSWDGSVKDVISADGSALSNTAWTTHNYQFTASTSSTRLEFADLGVPDSYGTFLDSVSAKCVPQQQNHDVPEFTTIGAGLVLAGAGAYMYRKRKY